MAVILRYLVSLRCMRICDFALYTLLYTIFLFAQYVGLTLSVIDTLSMGPRIKLDTALSPRPCNPSRSRDPLYHPLPPQRMQPQTGY